MPQSTDSNMKFPLAGDALTRLVMQRLRDNAIRLLPIAEDIAVFCGTDIAKVGTWFVDPEAKPLGGVATLRLWYLMKQVGVPSPEIDAAAATSPYGVLVGKLLAYDVIDMNEARELCGGVKDGAVLGAARGGKPAAGNLTLDNLERYSADLTTAIGMVQEQISPKLAAISQSQATGDVFQRATPTSDTTDRSRARDVTEASPAKPEAPIRYDLIQPIAETLTKAHVDVVFALAELRPEELAALRQLTGEDLPFNLKNKLAALCGTRAQRVMEGN